jgi:hypothetical protein
MNFWSQEIRINGSWDTAIENRANKTGLVSQILFANSLKGDTGR